MLNTVKCSYTWYKPQTQIPTLWDSDCACDSDVSFPVLFTCFRVSPNGDPTPNKWGRFKVLLQELSEPSSHTISAYSSFPIILFVLMLYKLKYSLIRKITQKLNLSKQWRWYSYFCQYTWIKNDPKECFECLLKPWKLDCILMIQSENRN